MNKKNLFFDVNRSMFGLFGDKLKKIILYGSYANNKETSESDIDFFVLVDDNDVNLQKSRYKIADVMTELSLQYDVLVSITEETCRKYEKYSECLPFYKNISRSGIEIYER